MAAVSELRLGKKLGAGHYGEVFEGQHPVHNLVAVKKLTQMPGESDHDWEQRVHDLQQEGKHLKTAEHARVVRVLDLRYSDSENAVLLVLEYCGRGALQNAYEKGPMSLHRLRGYLSDSALGLQAVHARGLIHRDIKPANVLLDEQDRAKIADFGLVTDRLIFGYASGTGYSDHLAPEVWATRKTSIRSDVWAFGMTAYRLLHGREFYDELPRPRLSVRAGGFARRLPWLPHIPETWRRFVRKLMHDNVDFRYQDMGAVLSAISALPISPDWTTTYTKGSVKWERLRETRLIAVEWTRPSLRLQEWYAKSSPTGSLAGHSRTLGSSQGKVSARRAMDDLVAFFASQT